MRLNIEVVVWRGPIPESVHRIQAVALDAQGKTLLATEEPDRVTTFRSAAKPFQLLPLVERGHAERWRLTDEELAVMCASHTGSPYHVALVQGVLDRLGLDASALACGYHDPLDPESLALVTAHPEMRSRLYNNCSGKHAGMLCLALAEGWPVEGYERAEHPLQQLMKQTVAEACGVAPGSLLTAIDGCSVLVFALPLSGMARAYARLATASSEGGARERALARIREAMRAFPRATGGSGRFSSDLMERGSSRRIAKGGAEGLECLALLDRGVGLAFKAEDGAARGLGPAVMAVLERLGELGADEAQRLRDLACPILRNHADAEVGRIEAKVTVQEAAIPEARGTR